MLFDLNSILVVIGDPTRKESLHITMSNSNKNNQFNDITKTSKQEKQKEKIKMKREPFYLPHWVLYPAWFLNLSVIFGCAFLVVWYGTTFGNKKSLEWLASVSIGLVSCNKLSFKRRDNIHITLFGLQSDILCRPS